MSESIPIIKRVLRGVRAAWCVSAMLTGGTAIVGILSAYLVCAALLDNVFVLPSPARWVCLCGAMVLAVAIAWRSLFAQFPLFAGNERVAAYFERRVPEAENRLINTVQLAFADDHLAYSNEMAARYVANSVRHLAGFSGWETFEKRRVLTHLKWAVGPMAVLVVYAALFWDPFSGAMYRLVHPSSTVNPASSLRLTVTPGNTTVVEGGDVAIRVRVAGGETESVYVEYEEHGAPEPGRMNMAAAEDSYAVTMYNISEPRTYRVVANPAKRRHTLLALRTLTRRPAVSRTYRVETVPPPRIDTFRIAYDFPEYIGRENQVDEDADGDIRAPSGTQVTIHGLCNKPLASAVFRTGETETDVSVNGRELEVAVVVETSRSYHFMLRGEDGFPNIDPIVHSIIAVPDRAPKITISVPDHDLTVDPGSTIPIVFEAADDYGLSRIDLYAKPGTQTEERVVQSFLDDDRAAPTARYEQATQVALARMNPAPGDLVQIWLEAADNKPDEPNRAQSRTINVRIRDEAAETGEGQEDESETGLTVEEGLMTVEEEPGQTIEDVAAQDKIEDALTEFIDRQREVIRQTNNLSPKEVEDLTGAEKDAFKDVAAAEDELSEFLEELVSDLSELPGQDFSESTLADEIVEVLAEVEMAEDALDMQNKLMAVTAEQVGLELAEELVHDLPSWLSDVRDYIKWDIEEPPEDYDVPMAELPEELTDLMGELIDEEADMTDEVEDESSSWADSLDAGAGWATMDGPISNMSAKGKTGNMLPNESEIGGRSGEGRTGRAHGEFVEKTAVGKGGRRTPTRISPDPYEPGIVEDSSTDPMGGATGGGKLSGSGGYGLPGPVPPEIQNSMKRLAGRQADIRAKAERLDFKLKVVNIPVPALGEAIGVMHEFEQDLRDFRYQNVLAKKDVLLKTMRDSHDNMRQQMTIRGERKIGLPKDAQAEILEALDEDVLPEYRDMVADYFQTLAESQR